MLGVIQQIVAAVLREHIPATAPPRVATPSDVEAPEEEAGEEGPVPMPIEGALEDERQGVPFTKAVMADELPMNCRTPAIAEYDGTLDTMEHLSRFENATLLHRYTHGIKCRVFVTTFTRAAQQWFNQLPVGAIGSFQEIRSLFLHQFASSMKLRKTELSLFAVRQKDNEPLKEYLQRFNAAALEVPSATQEVKASAFSQGLLDRDFFKSLAKSPFLNLMHSWLGQRNTLTWRMSRQLRKKVAEKNRKWSRRRPPSKKPRIDTRDKKPPFQRVKAVYTPLTVPITQAFMAVEEKGLLTCPRNMCVGRKPEARDPIKKERGAEGRVKETRTTSLERSPKEGAKQALGSKGNNNDIPRKRVIRMITGGPSGGDSHHVRKSQIREAYDVPPKEVIEVEAVEDTPFI
ncbi:UNVERIFIED_CONTAM: hypothetical protein Sradi_1775200 [Sesamum radiatum]|uniref:Retrotransposon gag domain-containing protein n=1 Tax=Sesamum radiatum TaxID=300843 RepID=A0AAW2TVY2_SESRA